MKLFKNFFSNFTFSRRFRGHIKVLRFQADSQHQLLAIVYEEFFLPVLHSRLGSFRWCTQLIIFCFNFILILGRFSFLWSTFICSCWLSPFPWNFRVEGNFYIFSHVLQKFHYETTQRCSLLQSYRIIGLWRLHRHIFNRRKTLNLK